MNAKNISPKAEEYPTWAPTRAPPTFAPTAPAPGTPVSVPKPRPNNPPAPERNAFGTIDPSRLPVWAASLSVPLSFPMLEDGILNLSLIIAATFPGVRFPLSIMFPASREYLKACDALL